MGLRIALPGFAALTLATVPAYADEPDHAAIVVAASPLGIVGQPVADSKALETSQAQTIAEQLARTAPGVSLAAIQGNPLQPDISYRGFTASPLLGTPQGLSVYLDGVRVNQPFGDVVSWDLIPASAIAAIDLVSGAAPQFGRNALGGALAVRTKGGKTDPGFSAETSYGSFNRLTTSAQAGGRFGNGLDWFVTADHFREDGWREFSPSRATRAFAKLGWSDAQSDIALSGLFADTDLNGNGLQEMRLLAADRASVYTAPDNTRNRAWLVALKGHRDLADGVALSGNLFWRHLRTATTNGDVNDAALGADPYQPTGAESAALSAGGYSGFPIAGETQANTPFPKWRCIADVLLDSDPNETCDGLVNRSLTTQGEWGGGAELVLGRRFAGIDQRLTLGLSYVDARAHFTQSSQFGYLVPDRTVVAVAGPGAFADGTQDSANAFDARVDLRARTASLGLYALESAHLSPRLRLDLAGRFDRTVIHNRDGITPGGGTGSLDSDPVYAHFNLAATLAWQPSAGVEATLSWSQASRAPSAIELGCSDPASPCRLPNALAGDPPLRQVIARAFEARVAIRRRHWSLSAAVFHTDASDDILFVADDPSGAGYFRNFGKTRRQGIELAGQASQAAWSVSASYTFLDATYRSPEIVDGSANSSSDAVAPGFDGTISIVPGDRIPLIPRHLFKAAIDWEAAHWLSFDLDMVASSGVYARGNENNLHRPDGVTTLGPGGTGGYAVFNAGITAQPGKAVTLFVTVENLFDRQYDTAAQLGFTAFDAGGAFVARPFAGPVIGGDRPLLSSTFTAPGAPRSVMGGIRVRY